MPPPTAPPAIVLADNDALIREAVGDLLRSKGYAVHAAEDGLAAWHCIRAVRPTYVILDVIMPKLDGSRVCWMIRQDPTLRETPVLVFSSLAARDFGHFPDLSADAYVAKGDFATAFPNLLRALAHLQAKGRTDIAGGILGYDAVPPRDIVAEMLLEIRRYATLVNALGPGTLELDPAGRILRASAGACELLGQSEAQLVGEPVDALCPAPDRPAVAQLVREVAAAPQTERCRTTVRFGARALPIHLCSIVDGGRCTGVLLILEAAGPPVDPAA